MFDARLALSDTFPLLTLWSSGREAATATLTEAWEMIPYPAGDWERDVKPTVVLHGEDDAELGPLSPALVDGVRMIDVKRDGYGARIRFDAPMAVRKGERETILIRLIDKPTVADQIGIRYRIEPY